MFKAGQPNPYDEIVANTTDENLTSENWEMILNLCDKVVEEKEQGARNVIAAILRRLTHRTSNVQLYTLTLAESLTKNCGVELHREIASRAFTQGLEKLITDRNTHDKVRRRALSLIAEWTSDFEKDPSLGIMEECYDSLKSKGYKFETPNEPPPPDVDDEVRRREEEELQRVLEMSMHDKGGRGGQWNQYSLASSSGAGSSAAASSTTHPAAAPAPASTASPTTSRPTYGGYVPSASPAVSANDVSVSTPTRAYSTNVATSPAPSVKSQDSTTIVTRVRALHTFEPTEPGELAFDKGDVIKVVDRGYKDWWRGQLKGRTGIFPVNYVEPLPEPTAADIAREAEQEAGVFGQAANVDRLLQMLRQMDPAKDNLADNEEIQELYRSCMSLRPKIVKLIDKYSQKRADLVTMNETFVKARTIFDRMMEESLARHTSAGGYDQGYGQSPYPRPDSRVNAFGWNPTVYDQPNYAGYPASAGAYPPGPEHGYPGGPPPAAPYVETGYQQPPQPGAYPPQPYGAPPSVYGAPTGQPQGYPTGPGPVPPQAPHVEPVQPQRQQQQQQHPGLIPIQTQPIPQQQPSQVPVQAAQQQPVQLQIQLQPQQQPQVQQQPQQQPEVHVAPTQPQMQPQAQAQSQHQPEQQQASQPSSGPPFVFDPNATYPDPNVQAWAQYYAQGGVDPTGSVYFISVPGVKEASPPPQTSPDAAAVQAGGFTTPLNHHGAGVSGSPGAQHTAPQAFHQAHAGEPNTSNASPSSPPAQGVPYGASPYAPAAASPGAEKPGWQAQYGGLPGQFSGMSVNGDGQAGHPSAQGVGASA